MNKGEIVLLPFPFTDLSGVKFRPAVVLVAGVEDVTVSFITSRLKWKVEFDIHLEPSLTNGLKTTSLVRLSKLATLDKKLIIGKLGELSENEIKILDQNLNKLFKIKM